MNYQPAFDPIARPISTRPRLQSISYGPNVGYHPDQAYYSEPLRHAQIHPESIRQYSTHGPVFAGGELSRHPSRSSRYLGSYEDDMYHDRDAYNTFDYQGPSMLSTSPSKLSRRHRRHSTYGAHAAAPFLDGLLRPSILKFKIKGGYHSGVSLIEAMDNVRLSGDKTYSHRDLNTDGRGNLYMKIIWSGYAPLTYEIPVDGYDGRMSLQTLMRRVSRACLHYVQSRAIPIRPERILLHSIEEVMPGTWQPVMTVQ